MIKYVPNHQIDRRKYDYCIEHSKQCRIYAFSWYLDSVTDRWDLMINGDYESVMPLPTRRKYGITYIYTPSWVQQLGIFSLQEPSVKMENDFLKCVSKKFLWIDYHMNSSNHLDLKSMIIKRNYVLPIKAKLHEIQLGYNQNRKRISKKAFGDFVIDKNGDLEFFIEKYRSHQKSYFVSDESISSLKNLCHNNPDHVHIWNVMKDSQLVAGLIWLENKQRVTYLVPFADKESKNNHIPTYLINELIKSFEGHDKLLDFEGSMVEGVEGFYKSFGAEVESYYYFKKRFINYG